MSKPDPDYPIIEVLRALEALAVDFQKRRKAMPWASGHADMSEAFTDAYCHTVATVGRVEE